MSKSKWTAASVLNSRLQFPIYDERDQLIGGADALGPVRAGFGKEVDALSNSPEGQPEAWANAQLFAAAPTLKAERDRAVSLLREGAASFPHLKSERKAHIAWMESARAFLAEVDK